MPTSRSTSSSDFRPTSGAREPSVEWQEIAASAIFLIHRYFLIDIQMLWDIVETKLPGPGTGVRSILRD